MSIPLVAIVGRPNVGKSTLFNRLTGKKQAVVEKQPGVTRDRNYAPCLWRGRRFTIIDTGGFTLEHSTLQKEVRMQVELAVGEADVIILVIDGQEGVTPDDADIAERIRATGKPVLLAVNKVDTPDHISLTVDAYRLGLGEPLGVSAIHGTGVHELLEALYEHLVDTEEPEGDDETLQVAIVGRPNVGKSSILNALVGAPRSIVLDEPGTTRDVIDTRWRWRDREVILLDTAGLRRRSRVGEALEYYTVLRAMRALGRADVVVLVLDGLDGPTHQDKEIARFAEEAGRALVIAVNKWDLMRAQAEEEGGPRADEQVLRKDYGIALHKEMEYIGFAPVEFVSATERWGLDSLMEAVVEAAAQHAVRVPTGMLNRTVQAILGERQLSHHGEQLRIYYATQVATGPPAFVFFVNSPKKVHFSHQRFLENRLREAFGFVGTPIRLSFREASGDRHPRKARA